MYTYSSLSTFVQIVLPYSEDAIIIIIAMSNNGDLNVIDGHFGFYPCVYSYRRHIQSSIYYTCVSLIAFRVEIYQCYGLDF